MNRKLIYGLIVALFFGVVGAFVLYSNADDPEISSSLISGELEIDGFSRADGVVPFAFPQDYGPHEDFQTEWWYYTGNLADEQGNRYGFQLTFFRRALLSEDMREPRESDWAMEQIYFAHFALTDAAGDAFYNFERFSRDSIGISGAVASPYHIWLENWSVAEIGAGVYELHAQANEIELFLTLKDLKGPVPQGIEGYSQKGSEPGNASYYYSQSRLEADGEITIDGEKIPVNGLSWKDHEYSTSALSAGQVGWDWFSMQLDNDIEIMLFYLRRADGSIDPFSSGTIIYPDGTTALLEREAFEIKVTDTWTSPITKAEYPAAWEVRIPAFDVELFIEPHLANQELLASFVYWEGAVGITGTMDGVTVQGNGYIELTGYYKSMEGEF